MDITNITFDELAIGNGIEVSRLVTARDVELFAVVSGDHNPLHLDPEYAATTQFGECIGHGMLIGAFVSAVIGLEFMGPGTVYLGQNLEFRSPIFLGDTLNISLTVTDKHARKPCHRRREVARRCVLFETVPELLPRGRRCRAQRGRSFISGFRVSYIGPVMYLNN